MSALQLRPRSSLERGYGMENCDAGCIVAAETRSRMFRAASHQAFIMGRHAAWLCEDCAKTWRRAWAAMGGAEVSLGRAKAAARGRDDFLDEVAA